MARSRCKDGHGAHTCVQADSWGQKLRWEDVVSEDLKGCKVDKDWREIAQDCSGWTAVVEKW